MIQGCGMQIDLDERQSRRAVIASDSEAIQKRGAVSAAIYLTGAAGLPRRLSPPRNDGGGVSLRAAAKQSSSVRL
jgi:mRNA-degrading endonuclease toxin of MazEF toxin-antitoxin module